MFSPLQSVEIRGAAGEPLPTVFKALADKGTHFLRGQLCLVAAGPGTGKSAFILTLAMKSSLPVLYFSADSDAFTQISRMICIQTGWRFDQAANLVRSGDVSLVSDKLDLPLRFNYDASPSLDQLERSMRAYEEVYGVFPSIVVVDNLTNLRGGGANDDDPYAGLEAMLDYLHTMARQTGAVVFALHHVTGPYNDADQPIPLSGVKGQITRVPELILTMHRVPEPFGSDSLRVSTVKNRAGRCDPTGRDYAELEFLGTNMTIKDFD